MTDPRLAQAEALLETAIGYIVAPLNEPGRMPDALSIPEREFVARARAFLAPEPARAKREVRAYEYVGTAEEAREVRYSGDLLDALKEMIRTQFVRNYHGFDPKEDSITQRAEWAVEPILDAAKALASDAADDVRWRIDSVNARKPVAEPAPSRGAFKVGDRVRIVRHIPDSNERANALLPIGSEWTILRPSKVNPGMFALRVHDGWYWDAHPSEIEPAPAPAPPATHELEPSSKAAPRRTAWFAENPAGLWLGRDSEHHTRDPNDARPFATKADAEAWIAADRKRGPHPGVTFYRATEHVFFGDDDVRAARESSPAPHDAAPAKGHDEEGVEVAILAMVGCYTQHGAGRMTLAEAYKSTEAMRAAVARAVAAERERAAKVCEREFASHKNDSKFRYAAEACAAAIRADAGGRG